MKSYIAQEKQKAFHFATADEVFYGGAAGGGKSYAIIWDAVSFCMENPQVTVAIFRRTYPELEKSIILEALRSIPQHWYRYNKKEHRMYFSNGSIIEFNYCLYESDVYNFQSAQYERIYFDELTHFTKFIYLYLTSRCRTTKENIKPQIKSASNPGNIGHEWVKLRFIRDVLPNTLTERRDPESGAVYTTEFIPAKLSDNKYLAKNGDYAQMLKRLDRIERRMLLEGDWDILKGQFFAEWRYDIHVIEPINIPNWWTRIRGLDWGFKNPSAVIWIAFSPTGEAYVYREFVATELTDGQLSSKIKELSKTMVDNKLIDEKIDYTMADPSLWSVNQYERGESVAMRMMAQGINMVKADNNRVSGWNVIHSYLGYDDTHKPKLKVFNTCNYLIETIPGLIHDEHNPEDLNTKGDDHGADALRYALMSKPYLPKHPTLRIPQLSFEYWMKKSADEKARKGYVGTL